MTGLALTPCHLPAIPNFNLHTNNRFSALKDELENKINSTEERTIQTSNYHNPHKIQSLIQPAGILTPFRNLNKKRPKEENYESENLITSILRRIITSLVDNPAWSTSPAWSTGITSLVDWDGRIIEDVEPKIEFWQEEIIYQVYPRSLQDGNADGVGDLAGECCV
ncbi:Glycoside hydrolase superfamily [Trinorchestia longiramus]|nr:Glycoside hydrolase superfamily [Trinorchestia longiramus]